ncbi:hypothetical protein [Metasolibacillus sp.]|uniref:hypothetical protein n=1 Tax=Metasolibacillus sp. TaxID=2703680 RepID=UPI0025EA5642|nr:hypothetical protein [Metasolibacillus sp.]MCT6924264.1 hypothetical protein [Metasolibacillus sp.]MCT6940334.1 hypothetical protein [Metasolibacillus sp.]
MNNMPKKDAKKLNDTNYQKYNSEAARITLMIFMVFLILWVVYEGLVYTKVPTTPILLLGSITLTISIVRSYLMKKDAKWSNKK